MAVEGVKTLTWGQPSVNLLAGDRLHLSHGPIDLIIKAEGDINDVKRAYAVAVKRFQTVLGELVQELSELRKPLVKSIPQFNASIPNRMVQACWPHRQHFITPMAAVAGSVADEMKTVILAASPELRTLYVNNGGDIAVYASAHAVLKIGLVADLAKAMPEGVITIDHATAIGGIATSGWRGRSFSRGIADAVTVVARTAAIADAAATMIANAVDANSAAISRAPARLLDPDSDLIDLLVTTKVGRLTLAEIDQALSEGAASASALIKSGRIIGCCMALQGDIRLMKDCAAWKISLPATS